MISLLSVELVTAYILQISVFKTYPTTLDIGEFKVLERFLRTVELQFGLQHFIMFYFLKISRIFTFSFVDFSELETTCLNYVRCRQCSGADTGGREWGDIRPPEFGIFCSYFQNSFSIAC